MSWPVHEAKARFSELLEKSIAEGPQIVTKRGVETAGILREYKRKRYFKSNGELQREKAKAAARRRTKRFRGPRPLRPAR